MAETKQEIKQKRQQHIEQVPKKWKFEEDEKWQNWWSGRTKNMTKIKGTKVTREQFKQEKNTKTQKTHGRKSQEDFKQKNTKTQHMVCVFVFSHHKKREKNTETHHTAVCFCVLYS